MIIDLIKFILFVYAACPDHCRQCQVNAASGSVECNSNMCDNGYGIKESDKTCTGMHSYVYLSIYDRDVCPTVMLFQLVQSFFVGR